MTIDQNADWLCDKKIDSLDTGLGLLGDRVTILENSSKSNWTLYTNKDWSELTDENGKAKQDIMLVLCFNLSITSTSSPGTHTHTITVPVLICKDMKFDESGYVEQHTFFSASGDFYESYPQKSSIVIGTVVSVNNSSHNMITGNELKLISNQISYYKPSSSGGITPQFMIDDLVLSKGISYPPNITSNSENVYLFIKQ